ncbi:hypothetical protein E1I18_03540 [Mycoplasmopsis mucosicanis]|uniref:Uncharacterized protein n=1 Tax=Mycoplasmopsis mucosicanis TaxID=458208 RepID=A0A507SHK2_9BACT|nr:hypothetical protein [Mycoplasmopsis mucosicanis]TQC51260.1 hypothetical protein E1I18_03540 [Mycoplasmopsis mucosicanis]
MKNQSYETKNDLIFRQITKHSDWTNKQLSIALDVSISTIKRKRKQLREFQKTGTKIKISHGNLNNKHALKHSDEKFIALSKTYFDNYRLTGNENNNSSSFLSLISFYKYFERFECSEPKDFSYSTLVSRFKQLGIASPYATKEGKKIAKRNKINL